MVNQDFFFQALIYLAAAVISVPLAKKLGLGSVIGYLIAGIIIGPFVLGFVGTEADKVMHFAEFGVVLMLFVIGLELQPSLLWKMRKSIFGLGGLQVFITAIAIMILSMLFGFRLNQSAGIGLILALSSTAIVLQTLTEKGLMKNIAGRSAFSVLLFQDISVVPILAILPILAAMGGSDVIGNSELKNIEGFVALPGWAQLLIIMAAIAAIIFTGKFIARHVFRIVAGSGIREVFTALALLLVIGIALAMDKLGLSPALGTFIAGVVLADSEYSHELEITIDPFKGLLLGLFFISVGASINFALFLETPYLIVGLVLLLILVKFIILFLLGRLFRLRKGYDFLFAFLLAQSSEFAFVLISFARQNSLLDTRTASLLLLVVTLSMAVSPLLLIFNDRVINPLLTKLHNPGGRDEIEASDNPVILMGFGRFGLVIGRLLQANGFKVTIIDGNPTNIEILRKFGFKLFYGDVKNPLIIEKAGIQHAKLVILSMAEYDDALKVADYIAQNYPKVKILARARDVFHVFEFYNRHIKDVQPEVFHSAAELGQQALINLGFNRYEAFRSTRTFKHHEESVLLDLYKHWKEDSGKFIQETRRFSKQLSDTLLAEKNYSIHESDCAWDVESLRKEAVEKTET